MIAEYASKIAEVFKKKPETMAVLGAMLTVLFASISWTFVMYITLAMSITGYLLYSRKAKRGTKDKR